jgi:hydrophobe/amphiphile efflux-1 (HAE1) family protein
MIWSFCIRRPVLTVVAFVVIAIFGLYGYSQMPIRENPDVDFPIVSVNVVLPGAEPTVIETEVIEPLEEEINTIEGLKELRSTARYQVATITAEFELWRDIDVATQDVRDRVDRTARELPDDIEEPIVRKLDPDAQAIIWIALTGDDRWDEVRLTTYADETLKERLENLRGVGRVIIGGARRYAARVRLDPARLAAYHLTVQDIVMTIRANNVDIPSGLIRSRKREFLVRTLGQFEEAEQLNDLVVAFRDGAAVRIRDVGTAQDGVENDRQTARFVGQTSVGLGIVKQSQANTVAVAAGVRQRMAKLGQNFPPGLKYVVASDDSDYIQASINDLLFTIFLTTGLVIAVVLLFLRNVRSTLVTSFAVPTSLLGGMAAMHILDFSINTLTILGLILAIGIVIDDAIVVIENSYRHIEEGAEARPAARVGTTEVAFPAVANSLSLAAVFIPVAFTSGLIGRFFYEFGLTVAITVFASTFTALTLTPMLASRVLAKTPRKGRLFRWSEAALDKSENFYARLLDGGIRHPALTILVALALFAAGLFLFARLPTEFTPTVDRSQFIISFETPEGTTLEQTDEFSRRIEDILSETEEIKHYFLAIGLSRGGGPGKVNEGISFVRLTDRDKRQRHQSEIAEELRRRLGRVPLGRAYVLETSPGAIQAQAPIQVVLQHSDIDELAKQNEELMAWLRSQDGFTGVNSDMKMNKPQIHVRIKRDKASQMGISVAAISNTMRYLLGEPDISEIEKASERYEVITEITGKGEMVPADVNDLYVRSTGGELVSLANLAEATETIGPSELHHFDRLRSATISSSLSAGMTLGEALEKIEDHLAVNLPGDFSYEFTGESQSFVESFQNLTVTLLFSVTFIYLVLAAQFESFVQPFVILLSLPLAMVGSAAALWALGMPFGIVAFIGFIMLLGMATKNAILLVDYTNVLLARGNDITEAAKKASRVRFRPVIMTTISTVLGISPIALGYGVGGEARAPMGVTVLFGLLATTFLTLVVIPVVYTLVARLGRAVTNSMNRES